MLRAIHILPEFENKLLIEELRKKFDPLYGLVPPHMTLVFPFNSEISTPRLEQHVRETLVGVSPFLIQLKGITATLDNHLFLNVKKGNDNIIELHDRMYTGLLSRFMNRRYTYVPHLTVGRFNDETKLQSGLDDTETFEVSFNTVVTKVAAEFIESNGDSTIEFVVSLS